MSVCEWAGPSENGYGVIYTRETDIRISMLRWAVSKCTVLWTFSLSVHVEYYIMSSAFW